MNGIDSVMTALAEKARRPEDPNDFRRGGLLHCGICGGAKECAVELDGRSILARCMCRCEEAEYEAEQREKRARENAMRIEDLRVQGIQDKAMRGFTFEAADPKVNPENMAKCREYVRRWKAFREENLGLLLAGPPGTGKTYAAACIANALIGKGVPVLATSFPRILNSGRWDKAELAGQMKAFGLLVIDDLGTERDSGYSLEIVQMVIDERYKTRKPLIVTTNLSKREMDAPPNMDYRRIFDRLGEMCVPVFFGGPSLRQELAERKRRFAREVFG